MVEKVIGIARISPKNQLTIPKDVMIRFKFKVGDRVLFIEDSGKLIVRKA